MKPLGLAKSCANTQPLSHTPLSSWSTMARKTEPPRQPRRPGRKLSLSAGAAKPPQSPPHSRAIDSELVLMVDGDGSYPADGARLLVDQYLREPVDMITGIRSAQDATKAFRPLHQWGMSIFAAVLNSVFRFKPLDLFSGLRLFSRRFYKHVPVLSRGFELEIELTIQAVDKGFAQTEIPVPFRSRAKDPHQNSIPSAMACAFFVCSSFSFAITGRSLFSVTWPVAVAAFGFSGRLCSDRRIFHYRFGQSSAPGRACREPGNSLGRDRLVGLLLEANLRYHREAYHIQLRKYGAPVVGQCARRKVSARDCR